MKILSEKVRGNMAIQGYRDLLAAGWLGEQMFAQLGLHRAVSVLEDPGERTKVIAQSWKNERPFNAALALGLAGVSVAGLIRDRDRNSPLDVLASGCALGAVATGIGCAIAGRAVNHAARSTPIQTGFTPNRDTPPAARTAQKALSILAPTGILLGLASIGLSIAARARLSSFKL